MKDKHEMADLAPRDIVTREILKELSRTSTDRAFLDCSAMTKEFFSSRFPTIYKECLSRGINIPEDQIPIHPAQHYLMGGVRTDLDGMTNIKGLYCCGEAAEVGIHGGNRLASNSVLECLVFGRRVARAINSSKNVSPFNNFSIEVDEASSSPLSKEKLDDYYSCIKKTMSKYAGPIRTTQGLKTALEIITSIYDDIKCASLTCPEDFKIFNMCQVSLMIISAALERKESVGAHYLAED